MISFTWFAVWLAILMTCAICFSWATRTKSLKRGKIFACLGSVAGIIALWMIVVVILAETHSILGGIIWLGVGLGGTLYLAYLAFGSILRTDTTAQERG